MVWNIPLASLGHLSWDYLLPAPAASPASLVAGQHKEPKSMHWVCTAQPQLNHRGVIGIILIQNPKHSTIPATGRKINSVPAKTRAAAPLFLRELYLR